jgi:uncharacterized protein
MHRRDAAWRRYPPSMGVVLDLRRLRLRHGEVRREHLDVEIEPFELGGERYQAAPDVVTAEVDVARPSGAYVLDLRASVHVAGPCMRCLAEAQLDIDVRAREFHDDDAPRGDELRSDYVTDERVDVGTWLRDAVALSIPDRILCRPDCAGLCPVCGRDLNVEPHEHDEQVLDPRWGALEELRDRL